jgi:Fe-S-cluster containining protein
MKACNQCGKCCIKYGGEDLSVTPQEIEQWELFNPEIFQYVKNNRVWHDPDSGEPLAVCPFLEVEQSKTPSANTKYTCSIYLDRPEDCRHYPSLISEMIADGCEMIETVDLNNHKLAQRKLDTLMQDSRPAKS